MLLFDIVKPTVHRAFAMVLFVHKCVGVTVSHDTSKWFILPKRW